MAPCRSSSGRATIHSPATSTPTGAREKEKDKDKEKWEKENGEKE